MTTDWRWLFRALEVGFHPQSLLEGLLVLFRVRPRI